LNHLRIENDGLVAAGAVALGSTGNSISNTITISNGRLIVTNSARTATLTVNEGALFLNGADLLTDRLQASSGSQSLISFPSGTANIRTLNLSGNTRIGDGLNNARLQLGPTTHTLGALIVAPNSTLVLAGTATGTITNSGLLEVGTNVAGVNLTGSLVLTPNGSLAFDLGGAVQRTGYDFIQVDGQATFSGLLRLRLVNGFVPASNSVFVLLSASAHSGSFVNAPNGARVTFEGTGVSCQVQYSAGVLRLLNFQNAAPATNEIDAAWAIRYFGHSPLTEAEKAADPDGDGASNYQEYFAGTDPLDGTSALRILSIRRNQFGQALIDFTSTTNRTYGVAFSNDLETWADVNSPTFTPISGGILQWLDTTAQTGEPRFYRITVR
jgi:hypothetical protein